MLNEDLLSDFAFPFKVKAILIRNWMFYYFPFQSENKCINIFPCQVKVIYLSDIKKGPTIGSS